MAEINLISPTDYNSFAEQLKPNFPKTISLSNLLKYDIPKKLFARRLQNNLIDHTEIAIKTTLSVPNLISCFAKNCLKDILENPAIVDWTQEILFFDVLEPQIPLYEEQSEKHGGSLNTFLKDYMILEDYSKVPTDVIIPSGLKAREIGPEQAEIIHSHWKYNRRFQIGNFQELLRVGGGIGLFREDTGQMISWIVINDYGSMGFLYTLEEHRRKGYAALVSALMVQKLLKMGMVPFCYLDNEDSPAIFSRMGFQRYTKGCWCLHVPN